MSSNPNSVKNVNQAQGPRTGTQGLSGKRAAFKEGKADRESLAKTILNACLLYTSDAIRDRRVTKSSINPALEPVESDVKPRKLKK